MVGYQLLTSRAVLGMFGDKLEQFEGESWIPELSMGPVLSDQAVEDYPFLGHVPTLRAKSGPPKAEGLRVKNITIRNEEYDVAIAIPDKWRRRDKTGQLDQRIAEFGDAQSVHWLDLISPLQADGEILPSFTGSPFYSATHVWGKSGVQSNIVTLSMATDFPFTTPGTVDRPSTQALAYAIIQGIKNIMTKRSDQGKVMHTSRRRWTCVFPMKLWDAGVAGISQMVLAGGQDNLLKGLIAAGHQIRVEMNPELDASMGGALSQFLVYATDAPRKAYIRQEEDLSGARAGVDLQVLDENSDHWKQNREIVVIAYASRGVGLGDPFTSAKVKIVA